MMEAIVENDVVFDVEKIRSDFPALQLKVNGHPLIYSDNGATTQKPQQVIDAVSGYYSASNANVHRGLHYLAEKATAGYEDARKKAGHFINAASEKEIILTSGTTAGINLVAHGWGSKFLKKDDEIILTEMEHHSNIVPWHLLAGRNGVKVRFAEIDDDGILKTDQLNALINDKTRLIVLTQMSNVLGTINPVKEITENARKKGIKVLVDAAQSVPNMKVDVQELGCDFLTFSAHKMVGPTGIGVLYARKELLEEMDPFLGGGEMIETVSKEKTTWASVPHKFEAGTPNIAGAFGFSAAIDYLQELGMDNIYTYKKRLTSYAIDCMKRINGLKIFGKAPQRGSAISFQLKNVHPFDLAQFLDQFGVAIRAGHHCAQPLMKRLDVSATSRASLYFYNTFQEVDIFVDKLEKAITFFE
jgi:cysteine desulfurase / selenocysteine lyase